MSCATGRIDITATRGAGDRPTDTIVEPLLATEAAAVYRGTQEMDEYGQEYMSSDIEMVYRDGIEMAQNIRVSEYIDSPYLQSKITDISYKITNTKVTIKIDSRRPIVQ